MLGQFTYEAATLEGQVVRGQVESSSAEALARTLEERGLFVLSVEEALDAAAGGGAWRGGRRRAVLEVTRAMAALVGAGMPLSRALGTARSLAEGELAEAMAAIQKGIERGEPLSSSLARYPQLFPPVYCGLVRAGERSGDLSGAFSGLVSQLEREEEIRSRLLSAMIYPLVLGVAGGMAILVLLFFVLPRFVEVLGDTGAALPRSTQFLLDLSLGLREGWQYLVAVAGLVVALLVASRFHESGRRFGSRLLLSVPGIRTFRRDALAARFARLVAVLIRGGAALLAALDDTRDSIADPVAREEVARIRARVREGSSLHLALKEGTVFPQILTGLAAIGEEAGKMPEFLQKAAEILERRSELSMQRLVSLVEPAMIVVFGGVVALVALSLLQAIYGVTPGLTP